MALGAGRLVVTGTGDGVGDGGGDERTTAGAGVGALSFVKHSTLLGQLQYLPL